MSPYDWVGKHLPLLFVCCILLVPNCTYVTKRQQEFKPKANQYAICRQLRLYEMNILLKTEGGISFRLYVDCKPHGCKQMERTDENEMTLYYYDVTNSHRIQIPSAVYTCSIQKGKCTWRTYDRPTCLHQSERGCRNRSHWCSSAVQARATFLSTFMLLCSRTTKPNLLAKFLSLMTVLRSRIKVVRHFI